LYKLHVIQSDSHFSIADPKAINLFLDFIADVKPPSVTCVGDLVELSAISRWNKGLKEEYVLKIQEDFDAAKDFLVRLRRVYSGPYVWKLGNHDIRLDTYLRKYGPGLGSLQSLSLGSLLDAERLRVDIRENLFDLCPGVVVAHGEEGEGKLQGSLALKMVHRFHKNVVCGHGHRQSILYKTYGYNGRGKRLFGMEAGHLMDTSKTDYVKCGTGDMQKGWGLIWQDGEKLRPELIPVIGNSIIWKG